MELPVLVKADHGESFAYQSRLENISACGLYVKLEREIPVGSAVAAIVTLADDSNLSVVGQIIRTSKDDGFYGHAVQYSDYSFNIE